MVNSSPQNQLLSVRYHEKCKRDYRITKAGEKVLMEPVIVKCSGCGRWTLVNPSCGLRNCDRCNQKRCKRMEHRHLPAVLAWKDKPGQMETFVTLEGIRIEVDGKFRENVKRFTDTAEKFLQSEYSLAGFGVTEHANPKVVVKPLVDVESSGSFCGIDFGGPATIITYEKSHYIHFHALVVGAFKDIGNFATRWRSVLLEAGLLDPNHDPLEGKHGVNLSVARSRRGTARYILGYITKGVQLSDEEVEVLKRLKLVRAWGGFRPIQEPLYDLICQDCEGKCYPVWGALAIEPMTHEKLRMKRVERPP